MKINPCPICGREPVVYCGEALINGVFRDVDIACINEAKVNRPAEWEVVE